MGGSGGELVNPYTVFHSVIFNSVPAIQVHDYVKSYVGDGKPQKKFAIEYLERRLHWNNSLKSGRKYEDVLTTPALALSPGDGDFQVLKFLIAYCVTSMGMYKKYSAL